MRRKQCKQSERTLSCPLCPEGKAKFEDHWWLAQHLSKKHLGHTKFHLGFACFCGEKFVASYCGGRRPRSLGTRTAALDHFAWHLRNIDLKAHIALSAMQEL